MRVSPSRGTLGVTPPISLSLGKRNGPRPVQRESAFRRISMTRPCHADRKARGPKKRVRADTAAVSVGRGPSFADCFSLWPAARNCNAMVLDRFGVRLFPLPLAWCAGAARSEAERAGPAGQAFRRPPRKQVGTLRLRQQALPVPPVSGASGRRLLTYAGTDHDNFRICGQLDTPVSS